MSSSLYSIPFTCSKGKLFYLNTVLCCDVLRLVRDWCSFNAGDVGDVPDVCQSIEMSVSQEGTREIQQSIKQHCIQRFNTVEYLMVLYIAVNTVEYHTALHIVVNTVYRVSHGIARQMPTETAALDLTLEFVVADLLQFCEKHLFTKAPQYTQYNQYRSRYMIH